jgi:hypothetical protein
MAKASKAKLFAVAAANVAAVGMAASPANASAQLASSPASGAAATAVPSTGTAHPGARRLSPDQVPPAIRAAMERAKASAGETPGFVPKASSKTGVVPETETGCSGHTCLGVYGGANYVENVNTSWFSGTGCHVGHIYVYSNYYYSYSSLKYGGQYICKNQEFSIGFYQDFPTGTMFCGRFNNISGSMCEYVH